MNTKITYLYRDGCNYKQLNEVIVNGHITEEQKRTIINCCDSKEYFIPRQVDFPESRFGKVDLETDTCWFELDESSFEDTSEEQTLDMTPEDVVKQFESAKGHWDDTDMSWMDDYDTDYDAEDDSEDDSEDDYDTDYDAE